MKNIILILLVVLCVLIIGCDNDISKVSLSSQNENNQGNDNDQGKGNNGNKGNEGNKANGPYIINDNPTVETDKINLLKGTIWYANNSSLIIEISSNYISFKNNQNYGNMGGNLNGIVTHGSFRISSYNGEIFKLLDYDEKEISFTLIITDNKINVNGLNAIKWTAPPYQPRSFNQWNGNYTKG